MPYEARFLWRKNIDAEHLRISGNCMEVKDTATQLSNIPLFSTTDISASPFSVLSIVVILIGLVLFKVSVIAALLVLAAGVVWIYLWDSSVEKAREMKRLTIVTNSGNAFPIVFNDKAFLSQVVNLLTDITRNPATAGEININVKDCTFSGNSHVVTNAIGKKRRQKRWSI